jgi:hypothetical protein
VPEILLRLFSKLAIGLQLLDQGGSKTNMREGTRSSKSVISATLAGLPLGVSKRVAMDQGRL